MVDVKSETKISPDELFLYGYLYMRRTYENIIETSIDALDQRFQFNTKNKSANKKQIYQMLISLQTYGYIHIENLSLNKLFIVNFIEQEKNGHVQIPYRTYREFDDPIEFYIYCYVKKFDDGHDIPDRIWTSTLNYFIFDENLQHGVKTKFYSLFKIRDIVRKMEDEGKIYKLSGAYYRNEEGRLRQDVNIYFINPSQEVLKVIQESKKKKENIKIRNEESTEKIANDRLFYDEVYEYIPSVHIGDGWGTSKFYDDEIDEIHNIW